MNKLYNIGLVINTVVALITSLLSLTAINAFTFIYEGSYYSFTLPTVAIALYCCAISLLGITKVIAKELAFWCVAPLGCLIFPAFCFALYSWPGGDDGPGMFWALFVGAGSILISITNVILLILGYILLFRTRDDT